MKEAPSDWQKQFDQIASSLSNGMVVVNADGDVVWMDEKTRRTIDGGLQALALPLDRSGLPSADCFISAVEVMIDGRPVRLCVLQESHAADSAAHELASAVEAVMADGAWFTRTVVEKVRAWSQARRPTARSSDLDLLTEREREILALICEGRSDLDMSKRLNLSQNTIRNHVASLYRKIGVNRRGAAIIWARERALTNQEFLAAKRRRSRTDQ